MNQRVIIWFQTIKSKVSNSTIFTDEKIQEKSLMIQMQDKLEIIENKLNYFMKSSPKRSITIRESQSVLEPKDKKFLDQAK